MTTRRSLDENRDHGNGSGSRQRQRTVTAVDVAAFPHPDDLEVSVNPISRSCVLRMGPYGPRTMKLIFDTPQEALGWLRAAVLLVEDEAEFRAGGRLVPIDNYGLPGVLEVELPFLTGDQL